MDELERSLRELGEQASELDGIAPDASVARRGARRRTATIAGAASLAVFLALAAFAVARTVSFGGGETVQASALATAADATEAAGTARTSFDMDMAMEASGMSFDVKSKAVGVIDLRSNLARMTMTFEGAGIPTTAMEMIQQGTIIYIKGEPGQDEDKWVKRDMAVPGFPDPVSSGGQNVTQTMDQFRAISGEVEVIGTDRLDGTPVTHYRATVDPDVVEEQMGEVVAQTSIDDIEVDFQPIEAWVDDNDLVRKIHTVMEATMTAPGSGEVRMTVDVTMLLYDFGIQVEISLPDEDEVVEADSPFGTGTTSEDEMVGTDVHILVGDDGALDPGVSLFTTAAGEVRQVCFGRIPPWAEEAAIVEEASDRSLFSVTDEIFVSEAEIVMGCTNDDVPQVLHHVIDRPSDYLLRFTSADRSEVVDLIGEAGEN